MRRRNDIIRNWHLNQTNPHRSIVRVYTRHSQDGELLRGIVRRVADGWSVTDYDGIHHGVHNIDYIEAERVLLDATAELDQITPTARSATDWRSPMPIFERTDEDRDYVTEISHVIRRFPNRTDPSVLAAAIVAELDGEDHNGSASAVDRIIREVNPDFTVGAGRLAEMIWDRLPNSR